jgi:hypothetical protein
MVPVTQVPTGKVKLHQVSPNGIPRRTARSVTAAAMASQAMANPQAGTPYSSAKTSAPAAYGACRVRPATLARFPAAVTDWPSGPSAIHRVGTRTAGSVLCVTRRPHSSVMTMTDANSEMPNIA